MPEDEYEPDETFSDDLIPCGLDADFDDSRDYDIPNHTFDEGY